MKKEITSFCIIIYIMLNCLPSAISIDRMNKMQVFHTVKGGKHYEEMHEYIHDLIKLDETYLCVIDGRLTQLDRDFKGIQTFNFEGSIGDVDVLTDKIILKVYDEDKGATLVFLNKETFKTTSKFQAVKKHFTYKIIGNKIFLVSLNTKEENDTDNFSFDIMVVDIDREIQLKSENYKFSKTIFPSYDKNQHEFFVYDLFESQDHLLIQMQCNFIEFLTLKVDTNLYLVNQFPVNNMKLFYSNGSNLLLCYQYEAFDCCHFKTIGLKCLNSGMEVIWNMEENEDNLLISNNQIHTTKCIYDIMTGKVIKSFDTKNSGYVGQESRLIAYNNEMYFLSDGNGLILADNGMKFLHQLPIFSYSLIFEKDRIIGIDRVICKTNRGEAGYRNKSVLSIFYIKNSNKKISIKIDDPNYFTDEEKNQFENLPPYLIKGRMFVDVDEFLRSLGGMMKYYSNYIYEDYDMTYYPFKNIRLYPNKPIAKIRIDINTMEEILIDKDRTITPKLIDGVIYAPLRFICDRFGLKLSWDQKTKTATVTVP